MRSRSGSVQYISAIARIACCAIFLIGLMSLTISATVAQDAGTPIAETPVPDLTIPTEAPTEVPTDEPTQAAPSETPTDVPTETATEIAPTATPEPPTLTSAPDPAPICTLPVGTTDVVASGGTVIYDCVYSLTLTGARLAPSWISVDWSLAVTMSGVWTVDVLPAFADAVWSPAAGTAPPLRLHTDAAPDASSEVVDAFAGAMQLAFQLRLTRPVCDLATAELHFEVTGAPVLTGHDDATITTATVPSPAEPYKLAPSLAPIADPTIAVTGSLDFGTVGLTASGPKQMPAPQTLTLTVTGLDQACGVWNLTMTSTTVDVKTEQEMSAPTLKLTAVDDQATAKDGLLLDGQTPALQIQAGASAPAVATYQLSIALVLPDQPALAAYAASLRVSLDAAGPKDQAPSASGHD